MTFDLPFENHAICVVKMPLNRIDEEKIEQMISRKKKKNSNRKIIKNTHSS
jgi:hypothetical protein